MTSIAVFPCSTPVVGGMDEESRAVQPGEEKTQGDRTAGFMALKDCPRQREQLCSDCPQGSEQQAGALESDLGLNPSSAIS